MIVDWADAIKVAKRWIEDPTCDIQYLDPKYGCVLQFNGIRLSLRITDRWAFVEFK